jgi:hypothetical protein
MFRMHDRTRRRVLMAGFVLLCVLPTVLVAGWCAWRNRPGKTADEAGRLGRMLGLRVALGRFEHARSGMVRYRDVELSDPETGRVLLRCPELTGTRVNAPKSAGGSKAVLQLTAQTAQLEARSIPRLGQVVTQLLRRETGGDVPNARLAIERLTLAGMEQTYELTHVEGDLLTVAAGSQVRASFRLAGGEAPEPVRVRIARDRQTNPPRTGFELDTGGGPLPCPLVALGLESFAALPAGSTYTGWLWAQESPEGWHGEATGSLANVDLEGLCAGRVGHRLTGTAQLTLQTARFRGGRLSEASGILSAGPGEIGRGLIETASRELAMRFAPASEPPDAIPYDHLALMFIVGADGLQLYGRSPMARGVVMAASDRWLLAEAAPSVQPRPVPALVRTLTTPTATQLPATPQATRLARYLPLAEPAAPSWPSVYLREAHRGQQDAVPR